jgi:rare lipoprotein A (peptidoglycan hydrolase)
MFEYILLASSLLAFTFGYNEKMCGSAKMPVACSVGAKTASGESFNPNIIASAALPLPRKFKLKTVMIKLKAKNGKCVTIRVNDRSPEKWIGKRGFEFTPAALRLLGIQPHKKWSGYVELCKDLKTNF